MGASAQPGTSRLQQSHRDVLEGDDSRAGPCSIRRGSQRRIRKRTCSPWSRRGLVVRSISAVTQVLEQLLALRDDDLRRHAKEGPSFFPATRPAAI